MNYTEFLESFENPIYQVEEKDPKCPKGFTWDKDLNYCVPNSETNSGTRGDPPPSGPAFPIWGATGVNGDGYALAVESKKPLPEIDMMLKASSLDASDPDRARKIRAALDSKYTGYIKDTKETRKKRK